MIVSEHPNETELLKVSQELDKLILQSLESDIYVKMVLGDEAMNEFDIILDKLQFFEKMYQSMRIVDPIRKKVLSMRENEICESEVICHDFWKRQKMCDNCISMRAYNEDDTIFKMEYSGNMVYMVTAVPIVFQGRKLVVELLKNATNSLYLGFGKPGEEIKILSSIEHINQLAVKDDLTELFNRRYINEKLPVDILSSSLKNEPLSIVFTDLDYFKKVNDTYGHSTGDHVLREFAGELVKYIRNGNDWVARYGGEEFMICLPNTDLDTAKAVAERIRVSIMQKEFIIDNKIKIHLTCSFGVHTIYNENESLTLDNIIEIVDRKLYQAKSEGRNKVV